jgi:hypothetical protein
LEALLANAGAAVTRAAAAEIVNADIVCGEARCDVAAREGRAIGAGGATMGGLALSHEW